MSSSAPKRASPQERRWGCEWSREAITDGLRLSRRLSNETSRPMPMQKRGRGQPPVFEPARGRRLSVGAQVRSAGAHICHWRGAVVPADDERVPGCSIIIIIIIAGGKQGCRGPAAGHAHRLAGLRRVRRLLSRVSHRDTKSARGGRREPARRWRAAGPRVDEGVAGCA